MNTTTTTAVITVDLMRPTINTIHVKQFDALSRFADIKIVFGGQPWSAGTSITYVVQYSKPDGTKGMYDKLPDGSTAVTSETDDTGSTVLHVRFAPQMFTVHGNVHCSVAMIKTDGVKLQTFSFCICVEKSDVNGDTSKDYYKMTTIDALMESIGDLSNLGTDTKESIVAAINEVLSGIPKDYVKSVNNVRPQANGDLLLHASDIDTQLPSISYQGSVEGALEAILSMPALPIASGTSGDGIAYTATGAWLPTVSVADNSLQISAVGKGRQIVFIPYEQNASDAPTLQLNGGEIIPLRLRAPRNQGRNDQAPDATQPIWIGALMCGVPYTLTFCGKYWLVDSQIAQFACAENEYQAAVMRAMAEVASGMADGDTIGMPIINSMDDIAGDVSIATIARSAAEYALPPEDGSVRLPTEQRVNEMIRKDITADYAAWSPESGTAKTVENYTKTLPDGRYRIWNDNTDYWFIDTFTIVNSQKWRIIRQYTDEFFYLTAYYGESIMLDMDVEVGTLALGGRTLLTNDNIPLPTAADVGKVLTASAAGRAAWTSVTNAEEVAV